MHTAMVRKELLRELAELGIASDMDGIIRLYNSSNYTGSVASASNDNLQGLVASLRKIGRRDIASDPDTDLNVPASSMAKEAVEIIHGDREKTYGDPGANLRTIATYWSTHLGCPVTTTDVCIMMKLLKMARLKTTPDHHDSWVDDIGYSLLNERVQEKDDDTP